MVWPPRPDEQVNGARQVHGRQPHPVPALIVDGVPEEAQEGREGRGRA